MTNLDVLWEPIDIGSMTVRNRVFVPAHEPVLSSTGESGGLIGDRYIAYLSERARGGAGLVMAGGASVHPDGEHYSHMPIYDDVCIPRYGTLAEAVHKHGAKVMVQLFHCGVQDLGTDRLDDWHAPIGPSAVPSPLYMRKAKAMDQADIDTAVDAFGSAARRMMMAGIDGVEIGGGHGYLLGQFLSPLYNHRDDAYGGSIQKRCKIVLDIAAAIREQCGREFPMGIRLSYDEFMGGLGVQPDDSDEILRILHGSGLFDFVNVSGITYHTFHFLAAPMTAQKDAHFVPSAVRAKRVVNSEIPVLVASVIKEIDRAAQVVGDGEADMVGMVRAHIADPDIVRKAQEGRSGEIRRCVGANQGCIRRYIGRNAITCTVNPAVGREREFGGAQESIADQSRSVLVVGGGPAGLKAAEAAARRGHGVTLIERGMELGGSLLLMGKLPDRERWLDLADDLSRSLGRLGVEVRLGEDVTAAQVLELAADVTIVATGAHHDQRGWSMSMPGRTGIPGAEQSHVITATAAIADPESVGASVVVVDDNGDHLPHGLALMLAQGGRKVEIISSQLYASSGLVVTNDLAWVYPKLVQNGVKVNSSTYVERIAASTVDVCGIWGDGQRTIAANTVVLCLTRSSNDGLYHELLDAGVNVKRIGDCVAPREVDDAVYEGEKAGRAV